MKEESRKKLATAAKKGRRIAVTAMAGAIVLGSIGYTKAAGVEDVFDEHYYADKYPDLKAAYGYNREALLEHFLKFGISEGRGMNGMIDIVSYRENYKDLQEAFGEDWDAYVEHYLSFGAFEHRENGTDFDPVDYLNRYGELKEAFGNDLLSAYKHYEEHGKQEGREARSEAVVKAEEAAEEIDDSEWVPEPTEKPAEPTEKPAEPTEKPAEPTEKPSEPEDAFEIQNVDVMSSGHIRVTLNRKTEQPLAQGAFSIICNGGGSDMTILSVSTKDNMVYDLTTAYYRDQEYDIQITFADGSTASMVFAYRTDCAQITDAAAVRTGVSEASITYNSDEPGYFYYILRENNQRLAREASSTEPTEAEVIENGVKTEMKQHQNVLTVDGLTEGVSYTMYYVAVNTEDKATLVKSLSIDGEVYVEQAAAIKSVKAFAEKFGSYEFLYGFEIELEAATSESLTLDQFDISCPQNKTTLGDIKTSDNKVYRVYMERGTVPKGNNTYTILINMKDGTQLKGTCYFDVQAPDVNIRGIEWVDEETIEVLVNSNEAGFLYYAVQDEVEGEGTTAAKDPTQIYAEGTKAAIGYGLNYIKVKGIKAGQWFCCASEDESGNREAFYSYKEIPEYTEIPDQEDRLRITGVTVLSASGRIKLRVVFNQPVMGLYDNTGTQISGIGKKLSCSTEYGSEGGMMDNVLTITVMDSSLSLTEGSHTLTITLYDGTALAYEFTV